MPRKKTNYIEIELDWAEEQLETWKTYINANPMHTLEDRIGEKLTMKGGVIPFVIANKEAQGKYLQETMKNYLGLLSEVKRLRQEESKLKEARGGGSVPHRMGGEATSSDED